MSSRLRDVLGLTVGLYLVAVGGLLALDSTGLLPIGTSSLVEGAVGLFLIALGVLSMLASWRAHRFARQLSRAFGHVRSGEDWRLEEGVIRAAIGDIHLDLRQATLPEGEVEVNLLCWVGTIHVQAPASVGLDVEAQAFIGSVDVLGVREDGFIRDIHVRTEAYDEAPHRLRLRISTVVGEILVVRATP
ncbi:MAG: cell wall-active antibiotics response protein LiaF [Chloroflexi bacterium]|nr:cell wall-active antibiotics response protein LiaF [Chloroflexota bacterium]MDA1239222.1 cell wall-active antibiotics response protein LiaF [Chloroflexota bacterium]